MNPRFQFRLRTLFIVVAIIATACALAAHAGPLGFIILAYSSAWLVTGIAGVVLTEFFRKKLRRPWTWVPLLFGVCSGVLFVAAAFGFLAIIFGAFVNQFFPNAFG